MMELPLTSSTAEQGRRIKAIREATGWRNKDLSVLTGITPALLSQHETGKKRITFDNAWRIARTTGVTTDFVYWGNPQGVSPVILRRVRAILRALPQDDA